jgi:DNA-binding XRE family transcriptional regulator
LNWTGQTIPARPIEQALKKVLKNLGQNKNILESVMAEATKESRKSVQPLEKDKAKIEETIARLTGQIKRITGILTQQDLVSQEIKDEYKGFLVEREQKRTALEKLQIDIDRLKNKSVDFDIIRKALEHFDQVIDSLPLDDQKELIQLLVREIKVYPFAPEKESKLNKGWFATKIRTNWYKVNVSIYEIPPQELNLSGESSETKKFGSPSRNRIRTFFTFPLIIGINQARDERTGIILPLRQAWLPMAELPKPKTKPTLEAILEALGPATTFGQKVRYYRIKSGLNQGDLAEKLGVVKSAVCQWETGQTIPKARHSNRLCRVLGIPAALGCRTRQASLSQN